MSMVDRLIVSALMCLVLASITNAQPGGAPVQQDFATVHVYRLGGSGGFLQHMFVTGKLPVMLLDKSAPSQELRRVAALKRKQYLILRLPPGEYALDTTWSLKLPLKLAAGDEVYVRFDEGHDCPTEDSVSISPPCNDRDPSIYPVPAPEAVEELKRVKPVSASDVYDKKLVVIPKPAGT